MFKSINPATGEEIAAHAELTDEEVDAKLARAADTYRQWRTTPLSVRTELLARIADRYEADKARLARTATEEMGKTYASAVAEVEKCAAAFRHYAEHGPAMLEPRTFRLANGGTAEAQWQPQGPVLAVMPWNFPYWQVVRFLAPTILAGNVGLLKHASIVQGVAELMEEMVLAAGGPEGLFQNLAIKSGAVERIIADDRVVAVTLTGSEGAGAAVAEQAGRNLKKVVLELGGSDPFIVMPSADLDKAVGQAVKARIQNTGQSCICAKRMIVHADIYDAFLDRFSAAMKAVKAGDPMDPASDMGPLSSFGQRDTVLGQLDEAKRLGAKLLVGGEKPDLPGAYLTAGILTDVPLDSPFANEELFGPIAMVFRAADIDEAIRIANEVPFGLGSSVWTDEPGEQQRFVRDIAAGMVAINQMLASAPEAPFGGIKRSGHGRELGPFGLHEFMNLKAVYRAAGDAAGGAGVE
ncbi:NAD-dependent succinate-semialdehyde dehydrogenase [Sphingomonas cannabina]|uniref:NAD-dependent succinate-semialdehyde dehydrogenase n=1 Tax=Sphingomonas cannabina TaxID=2899123 RepID=UPI001F485CDB|nr:NAD-dependent succinate-semialdehyde dehydrogenase [Sphingomonas cannabina]UIJ44539.1 NAD-dependent succinate-semialdehyde dehydrogenase [Sphingomonas cannabina]